MAKNKSQYDSTLNLPKTLFEMRAGLPKKEPVMLKDWDDNDLYNQLMKHNEGKPQFILHDGPPYANGNIHIGTALNKILKDMIVKHRNMTGYCAPYVPGWDTHGLPAELEAQKAELAKQQEEAKKAAEKEAERQQKAAEKEAERQARAAEREAERQAGAAEREAERQAKAAERERQKQKDAVARVATSILGSAGRTADNQIVRGLFGTRR